MANPYQYNFAHRDAQAARKAKLPLNYTTRNRLEDVAALRELQHLREINPFQAAEWAQANAEAIERAHYIVDGLREANPDATITAADAFTLLEAIETE